MQDALQRRARAAHGLGRAVAARTLADDLLGRRQLRHPADAKVVGLGMHSIVSGAAPVAPQKKTARGLAVLSGVLSFVYFMKSTTTRQPPVMRGQ
jgi:hypothetical protein